MREEEESVKDGARSIVSAHSAATKGPSWLVLLENEHTQGQSTQGRENCANLALRALLLGACHKDSPGPAPVLPNGGSLGTKTRELSLRSAPHPGVTLAAICLGLPILQMKIFEI